MNNKDHLQKIIDDWEYGKEHEGDPLASLVEEDIDWLIKKVKKYEEALDNVDWHTRTTALKHINWIAVEALKY